MRANQSTFPTKPFKRRFPMWDPYSEFQSATLPNGLTIHVAYWPGRPVIARFLIHSGAEHDPVGLEGVAHFVEHLVSENVDTPKKDLRTFFENCGGVVRLGTTGYPYSSYSFFMPTDDAVLAKSFSLFGNMLLSAKLERCIERERQVVIGEFNRSYPIKLKLDLCRREHKALYAGYWLERFVGAFGDPEGINRITQCDLQAYYDTHYTPANMEIICVGGKTLQELVKLISESPFAFSKVGARTLFPTPATDFAPLSETRYVFEIAKHVTMDAPTTVGEYESIAKIPRNFNSRAIRVASGMLNKILFEEVRERRAWVYAINASYQHLMHFYRFKIHCDGLAIEALNQIDGVIEMCIAKIATEEALFTQMKQRMLANIFMIDPDAAGISGGALDDLITDSKIRTLTEYRENMERVTMDDVREVLQWLTPDRRWTLITRP